MRFKDFANNPDSPTLPPLPAFRPLFLDGTDFEEALEAADNTNDDDASLCALIRAFDPFQE